MEFTLTTYVHRFGVGPSIIIKVKPTVIFQLIYTCALARQLNCSELKAIAQTSRARNLKLGITGILLCKDGSVLQVLEGDKDAVMELYEKITSDARITNPLILIKRMATEREFPKWSMGFKNADETDSAFKLCAQSFPDVLPDNSSTEVGTISRTFARVNGLA